MDDHAKPITELMDAYKAAVFSKNVDAFMALYASDVRIFDLWAPGSYQGAEAWRGSVTEWFGSLGTERVEVDIELVQSFVTETLAAAEAYVIYSAVSEAGEALRAMRNRLTWVIKPDATGWKIVHEHTSAPVDPSSMKVILSVDRPEA